MMSKKPTKTVAKVSTKATKKPNELHEKLIALLTRKDGATMHDTWNVGFEYPAMLALKIAERRGYKTSVVKKKGELSRYIAKRA